MLKIVSINFSEEKGILESLLETSRRAANAKQFIVRGMFVKNKSIARIVACTRNVHYIRNYQEFL